MKCPTATTTTSTVEEKLHVSLTCMGAARPVWCQRGNEGS